MNPAPMTCTKFGMNLARARNFMRTLAQSPPAMEAYRAAERSLAKSRLTAGEREQIALAVAEINDSKYCLAAHTASGKGAGLSPEDIRLARKAVAIDPRADAMLRFTQAIVLQRGDLGDEDLRALRLAGISEPEMVEIVATIAHNIFANYLSLVSRIEADFPLLHPEPNHAAAAGALCS